MTYLEITSQPFFLPNLDQRCTNSWKFWIPDLNLRNKPSKRKRPSHFDVVASTSHSIFKHTCRRIFTLSNGETHVLDTAPATPPDIMCFSWLLPGKRGFATWSFSAPSSSPRSCDREEGWISFLGTWAESFRTIFRYIKLHFHLQIRKGKKNCLLKCNIMNFPPGSRTQHKTPKSPYHNMTNQNK